MCERDGATQASDGATIGERFLHCVARRAQAARTPRLRSGQAKKPGHFGRNDTCWYGCAWEQLSRADIERPASESRPYKEKGRRADCPSVADLHKRLSGNAIH